MYKLNQYFETKYRVMHNLPEKVFYKQMQKHKSLNFKKSSTGDATKSPADGGITSMTSDDSSV